MCTVIGAIELSTNITHQIQVDYYRLLVFKSLRFGLKPEMHL